MPEHRHGHARQGKTATYVSWESARNRCRNPNSDSFYGDRGISFAPEWNDFNQFLADMGERPEGSTLDRINNDKGYEPGNCRWATPKQQAFNRRNTHLPEFHEFQGKRLRLEEWAAETGINKKTLSTRLHRGWSLERALTTFPLASN